MSTPRLVASVLIAFSACIPTKPAGNGGTGAPGDAGPAQTGTPADGGTTETNTCSPGEAVCGGTCIVVVDDPRNCGACGVTCPSNQVCSVRSCVAGPTDCRDPGATCPAHTWCNPADGKCAQGCSHNADCDPSGYCDLAAHACRCNQGLIQCGTACLSCQTPAHAAAVCAGASCDFRCDAGYHRCGDGCLADTSTDGCGQSCTPCPAPPGGFATCDGNQCGLACPSGSQLCGGSCTACPTTGVASTACSGTACVATACAPTYALSSGVCQLAWTVTTLGSGSDTPRLAVAPSGTPMVAWFNSGSSTGTVKLWDGSSTQGFSGNRLDDLTVDAAGRANLLMHDSSYRLEWLVPGVNAGETVPNSFDYGDPVLAVDSAGTVYVAANTGSSLYVPKVAIRGANGWSEETPTYSQVRGQQIAIGPQDVPWVMFLDNNYRYLFAQRTGTGWQVDASSQPGFHPRFAMRSDGVPVVVSSGGGTANVFDLATGGSSESVDTGLAEPYWVDVAVDGQNAPHVVFSDPNGGTYYATKRSGTWAIEQISSDDTLGPPLIGVDAQGGVYVAYTTYQSNAVVYAHRQ